MAHAPPLSADDEVSNPAVSFGLSLAVASVASALLVVAKEKSPRLMDGMRRATGHHWLTHSLGAVALFLIVGFALTRVNGGRGLRLGSRGLVGAMVGGVVSGALIIAGFYLFMD